MTNFFSTDREVIGERTLGLGGKDYIPDGLGSLSLAVSPSDISEQTLARFHAYGPTYILTSQTDIPYFLWVGSKGYKVTSRAHSDLYVRLRHYSFQEARWTTVDPLWPYQPAFIYAWSSPIMGIDPSGSCAITIKGTVNVAVCKAECSGGFGCAGPSCQFGFQYHAHFRMTRAGGCKDCDAYQWVSIENGPYGPDKGSPPHWPNLVLGGDGTAFFDDWPYLTGGSDDCTDEDFDRDFVTCVCCKNNSSCVKWSFRSNADQCQFPICVPKGPTLMPTTLSARWCAKTRR